MLSKPYMSLGTFTFSLLVTSCGGSPPSVTNPTTGATAALCDSPKCGARGDYTVPANEKNSAVYFDDAYRWVGMKVVPKGANWSRSPCGSSSPLTSDDLDPKGGAPRSGTYSFDAKLSSELKAGLIANISGALSSSVTGRAGVTAAIDRAVTKTVSGSYDFNATVYTIDDLKFSQRVQACGGQSGDEKVIYSLSAASLSGSGKQQIKDTLKANLSAEIGVALGGVADAGASGSADIDNAVNTAIESTTPKQAFVIALGFRNN